MGINKTLLGLLIIIIGQTKSFPDNTENKADKIIGINLTQKFPIVNRDSSLNVLESFYNVYYYENYILYKLNYEFDSSVNGETILEEKRYYFLVFHKDSAHGYKFFVKPDNGVVTEKVNNDSALKTAKLESNTYDTLIHVKPDSIYNTGNKIVKVYKNPGAGTTIQQSENFDLYFFYGKDLKDVPETFSKRMDNVKGMKLYKVLVAARRGFYKEYNMTFPPRDFILEMNEINIENRDQILSYFEKYKEGNL
jgi:hypothetical protein